MACTGEQSVSKFQGTSTMPTTTRKNGLVLMCLAFAFLSVLAPVPGELIINGDFSNALNGWSVSDPSLVSVVNCQAVNNETATVSEGDLYQILTVPSNAVM